MLNFLSLVRQRLHDNYVQIWNSRVNDSSRGRLYKHFDTFNYKPYLDIITVKQFRHAFTRLRVSSHPLQIEAGRWTRPRTLPDDRLCSLCGVIEDEFHFVLVCKKFDLLRHRYIPHYYWTYPSMFKFIDLISNDKSSVVRQLALYIHKAFLLNYGRC